jgi:hypothetical protein
MAAWIFSGCVRRSARVPGLHQEEHDEHQHADNQGCEHSRRGQGTGVPYQRERDEDGRQPADQGDRPGDVDVAHACLRRDSRHGDQDRRQGHQPDGHRQVEHPPPAPVVGDDTAHRRTDHHAEASDAEEDSLNLRPLLGREDVGGQGEDVRHQDAGAGTIGNPGGDQLAHVLRHAA